MSETLLRVIKGFKSITPTVNTTEAITLPDIENPLEKTTMINEPMSTDATINTVASTDITEDATDTPEKRSNSFFVNT